MLKNRFSRRELRIEPLESRFALSSVTGTVYWDQNGNGIQDLPTVVVGDRPTIVFVIDRSGSTDAQFKGSPVGDVNGDGWANTRLDAELAGLIALNQQLIARGLGNDTQIAIVAFDGTALIPYLDLSTHQVAFFDPNNASGQPWPKFLTASTDANANGMSDVEEILRGITSGGDTNFANALHAANELLTTSNMVAGNANIVFLSDGYDDTDITTELAQLRSVHHANIRAFGVGQDADLSTLQAMDPRAKLLLSTEDVFGVFGNVAAGTGEPGLAGVIVFDDANGNGILDRSEKWTITKADDPNTSADEAGTYVLEGLAPGAHHIRTLSLQGFKQSSPIGDGAHHLLLNAGENGFGNNFGMVVGDSTFSVDLPELTSGNGTNIPIAAPSQFTIPAALFAGSPRTFTYQITPLTSAVTLGSVRQVYGLGFAEHRPASAVSSAVGLASLPVPLAVRGAAVDELLDRLDAREFLDLEILPLPVEHDQIAVVAERGSIRGVVWQDEDQDGVRDRFEKNIVNARVFLDRNGNGQFDEGEFVATTDPEGRYEFGELTDDEYSVVVANLDTLGTAVESHQLVRVEAAARHHADVDFAFTPVVEPVVAEQPVEPTSWFSWVTVAVSGSVASLLCVIWSKRRKKQLQSDSTWHSPRPSSLPRRAINTLKTEALEDTICASGGRHATRTSW